MLKIGVLGAGHLGKIHLRQLKEISKFELVGFFDPDKISAEEVEKDKNVKSYPTLEKLVEEVDVVDIVTPTVTHFDCAKYAIGQGKHVFIEKPMTQTVEEADVLLKMIKGKGIKVQVGHVERFNPALLAARPFGLNPVFIEAHRLAEFRPRGTDVSVVLDLMIHDIDIILSLVNANVEHVSASGVPVISDTFDIANARIEFTNGCVANVTCSRISLKTERKLRIFQKNAYISLDFLRKEANIIKLREVAESEINDDMLVIDPGNGKPKKELVYSTPEIPDINAIRYELDQFADAILNDKDVVVSLTDGFATMKLAHMIHEKIERQAKKVNLI